jgi:hypothetical protein
MTEVGDEPLPRRHRWWGTEEEPTKLRKAWWLLKAAFFTV